MIMRAYLSGYAPYHNSVSHQKEKAMEKYKCEKCGKNHTIYRSMEIPLPRMISEISEEEREKRVKEFNGFLVLDDEFLFANGWVNIEVENYEFPL